MRKLIAKLPAFLRKESPPPLLSQLIAEFDRAHIGITKDTTRRWYALRLGNLLEFLGDVQIATISLAQLEDWRATLLSTKNRWSDHPTRPTKTGGLSRNTVHGYIRASRRFFNWCVSRGHLEKSPADGLAFPRITKSLPKAMSDSDASKILKALENHPRNYAIISLFLASGGRLNEITNIQLSDLDLVGRRAIIYNEKKNEIEYLRFDPKTATALHRYLLTRPTDMGDNLFIGQRGPLTDSGIYQIFRKTAKRLGIQGYYNPHSARHAFARRTLQKGKTDLGTVSRLMRHADVGVTHKFYAVWSEEELDKVYDQVNSMDDLLFSARDTLSSAELPKNERGGGTNRQKTEQGTSLKKTE